MSVVSPAALENRIEQKEILQIIFLRIAIHRNTEEKLSSRMQAFTRSCKLTLSSMLLSSLRTQNMEGYTRSKAMGEKSKIVQQLNQYCFIAGLPWGKISSQTIKK